MWRDDSTIHWNNLLGFAQIKLNFWCVSVEINFWCVCVSLSTGQHLYESYLANGWD